MILTYPISKARIGAGLWFGVVDAIGNIVLKLSSHHFHSFRKTKPFGLYPNNVLYTHESMLVMPAEKAAKKWK